MSEEDTMEQSKAIATASSDEYFPWLLNLLGSIQNNYPNHPRIFVYNLGMRDPAIKELTNIQNVEVREISHFVAHWRKCYTWKFWVLNDVPARNVYYIDAGSEVLGPLPEIFEIIEKEGYFCVSQKSFKNSLKDIVSPDLLQRLKIPENSIKDQEIIAGGNFGYKKNSAFHECVKKGVELAKEGWTMGWSADEEWRNIGPDQCNILRECRLYRHDQTLLNLLFHKNFGTLKIREEKKYAGYSSPDISSCQVIWAHRRRNRQLRYLNKISYRKKPYLTIFWNRLFCGKLLGRHVIARIINKLTPQIMKDKRQERS